MAVAASADEEEAAHEEEAADEEEAAVVEEDGHTLARAFEVFRLYSQRRNLHTQRDDPSWSNWPVTQCV